MLPLHHTRFLADSCRKGKVLVLKDGRCCGRWSGRVFRLRKEPAWGKASHWACLHASATIGGADGMSVELIAVSWERNYKTRKKQSWTPGRTPPPNSPSPSPNLLPRLQTTRRNKNESTALFHSLHYNNKIWTVIPVFSIPLFHARVIPVRPPPPDRLLGCRSSLSPPSPRYPSLHPPPSYAFSNRQQIRQTKPSPFHPASSSQDKPSLHPAAYLTPAPPCA